MILFAFATCRRIRMSELRLKVRTVGKAQQKAAHSPTGRSRQGSKAKV